MGSATNGPSSGTLTITYTDGTSQSATLGFTDWTAGSASLGNGVAARCPIATVRPDHRNRSGRRSSPTDIPLQTGKTVASVTLPDGSDQGLLHVFALGTDKGPLTTGS